MDKKKPLIVIPTYNEAENIEHLVLELSALDLGANLLFIDDNSPDGTGEILNGMMKSVPGLQVLHREGKLGIGSAHLTGIAWAYDNGYTRLLTMDADFTHSPGLVPRLLELSEDVDVVVGSRFMKSKSINGWSLARKCLTYGGHLATRTLLRMPFDATGAFRAYRLDRISRHVFDKVQSTGYSFMFESLYLLYLNGYKVREFEVALARRTYGSSKMKFIDILNSTKFLFSLTWRSKFDDGALKVPRMIEFQADMEDSFAQNDWNSYWEDKGYKGKWLYDLIATVYRKFIIKPALNYFITRHFPYNSVVLHAGCGSGQVDVDVANVVRLTALDISPVALRKYADCHDMTVNLVHGSILDIPVPDRSFNGIFNLGVMEHFTEPELERVLGEFNRILDIGGKVILFWPPVYGVPAKFLSLVQKTLTTILGRRIHLHPKEHTLISSREQVESLLESAGFTIQVYYFGARDLYTHIVVVAEKVDRCNDDRHLM